MHVYVHGLKNESPLPLSRHSCLVYLSATDRLVKIYKYTTIAPYANIRACV